MPDGKTDAGRDPTDYHDLRARLHDRESRNLALGDAERKQRNQRADQADHERGVEVEDEVVREGKKPEYEITDDDVEKDRDIFGADDDDYLVI